MVTIALITRKWLRGYFKNDSVIQIYWRRVVISYVV